MYLKLFITFTILNIHCKCNYLDQLSLDCKLRRMYLSILIKTIIIIIIIIIIILLTDLLCTRQFSKRDEVVLCLVRKFHLLAETIL